MYKLVSKNQGTIEQISNIYWIIKKVREFQKNIYFCFIDYTKAFDYVDPNELWKILTGGNTRAPYLSLEKPVCRSRSHSQTGHGTVDWFQNWERSTSRLNSHPAYLTYMQNASCEMPGWMKHRLESILLESGEISTTSNMQMIPP